MSYRRDVYMFNFFVTKMYLALNFALKVIKKLLLIKILGTVIKIH